MVVDMSYFTKVIKKVLILILTLVAIYLSFKLALFYMPFLIGFIISLLIEPLIKFINNKTKLTRKTSAIIVLVCIFTILIALISWGVITLITESSNLLQSLNIYIEKIYIQIQRYINNIDFEKVIKNVDEIKVELNILNSLIGSKNIEDEFEKVVTRYPETLKCIPLLLAVRSNEIYAQDEDGAFLYNFKTMNYAVEQYKVFMRKTGLFDMIANHLVNNLVDYALGIETGLDSNGRKNRGGHQMEDLVEKYIVAAGFKKNENYFKEMYLKDIESKWNIDLSALSNQGKAAKRFDFVIKTDKMIYAIETNFYGGGGSKLNETARSYKMLSQEADTIDGFTFVWFTDGIGWKSARGNLRETFEVMDTIYSIDDMENRIIEKLTK